MNLPQNRINGIPVRAWNVRMASGKVVLKHLTDEEVLAKIAKGVRCEPHDISADALIDTICTEVQETLDMLDSLG